MLHAVGGDGTIPQTPGPQTAAGPSDLLTAVYQQLRAIAQRQMNDERRGHTLQATALVNEAYLRLVAAGATWSDPSVFYHAAAEAMRRILIEHARKRGAGKRGGGRAKIDLDVRQLADLAGVDADGIVAVDEAIQRLGGADPRAASVVRLRFFAGLSVEGTAAALGLSDRTVRREWEYARAWLYHALGSGTGEPETTP